MSLTYPESVEAHVKQLRKQFTKALGSSKKDRNKTPLPEHLVHTVRCGVRKGFKKGLAQSKCSGNVSKQARKDIEDVIICQINSELDSYNQSVGHIDDIPRAVLGQLNVSFNHLSHKYTRKAATSAVSAYLAGGDLPTVPTSPTDDIFKLEDDSDLESDELSSTRDESDSMSPRIVITLVNHELASSIGAEDLTQLVNQSIGSDPEIPIHLKDSQWITGTNLLKNGDIEVHVETENDCEFLKLNTHWRPKLAQLLEARFKRKDEFDLEDLHPMACAYDGPRIEEQPTKQHNGCSSTGLGPQIASTDGLIIASGRSNRGVVLPLSGHQHKRPGALISGGLSSSDSDPKRSKLTMDERYLTSGGSLRCGLEAN